jgi:DTW domain-containing protein YfiP
MRGEIKSLIVPDGSWPRVKQMLKEGDGRLRRNRVRYVQLPESGVKSFYEIYGVRKEPEIGHLSTLEAVAIALSILSPEVDTQHVLDKFESHLKEIISMRRSGDLEASMISD